MMQFTLIWIHSNLFATGAREFLQAVHWLALHKLTQLLTYIPLFTQVSRGVLHLDFWQIY